ncbi:MAG: hypothetical protein AAF721_13765 [Myxococcota bacterium]
METGPCLDGDCFEGLMCLSNLCVGDEAAETGGDGGGDGGGPGDGGGGGNETPADDDGQPDDGDDGQPDDGPGDDAPDDGPGDDAPGDDDTGPTTFEGCEAIDFLFVIDNSPSMAQEQARLLAALPGFVSDIQGRLGTTNPHFMVADVDAWPYAVCDGACDPPAECLDTNGICNIFGPGDCPAICSSGGLCMQTYPCEGIEHDACDEVLGAGVDETFGTNSSEQACDFASGGRYIDADEPDLLDALGCAMQVGTGSFTPVERPMEALVQAVSSSGDAAACNDGFLRDGAPLVVVFITDEDDGAGDSAGNPASWHTALLDAKGGDPDLVVVLGLFGDGDEPFSQCNAAPEEGGAETSPRLRSFMQLWGDNGVFGSVCAPNYADSFAAAADVTQSLCAR